MQVTAFPRVSWAFGPGQHRFVYLPGLDKFWESHPFSIAAGNKTGSTRPGSTSGARSNHSAREDGGKSSVVSSGTELNSQPSSEETVSGNLPTCPRAERSVNPGPDTCPLWNDLCP